MNLWGSAFHAEGRGTLAGEEQVGSLFTMRALRHLLCLSVSLYFSFPRSKSMTRVVRYTAHVDPDVRYSQEEFSDLLQIYLADPDGWEAHGYRFIHVTANPDVEIRLVSPASITKICGLPSNLSCAELGGKRMYLNAKRWLHGSPQSKQSLDGYRQYVVSHEMGHILGYDHVKCPAPGDPAPIMMQQTLGIGQCLPNTRITKTDLKAKWVAGSSEHRSI